MALSTRLNSSRCCCNASAEAALLEIGGVLSNQHSSRRVTRKYPKKKTPRDSAVAFEVDAMAAVVSIISLTWRNDC